MTARGLLMAAALGLGSAAAGLPARAAADAERGQAIYARCLACHALAFDRVGPRHCGLLGRRAGSVPGFAYSPALKQSGIVWDETSLDRFLAAPTRAVPGTTMTYDGIPDRQDRADLMAYLQRAGRSAACGTSASSPR